MTAQQYGASKEYQKWQARTRDKDPEEGEKLREQADAEAEVNASEYALSTGINATFGGVYQLLSTSADQFLEIQKTTSEEDSTALRAALADRATRSKMAWFRIQPGFRTRNEGEKVRMGDTVVLESVKMQSMYLHCNMQADMTREVAEVNFFDQATRFKVVPISKFSEVQQVKRSQGVCAGSFVEIYRRQSSGYVYRNHMTNRGCLLKVDAVADAADAVPIPKLQADLLWQLNLPNMTWNGEPVMHDRSYSQRFSLRDAISGYFLFDDGSGEIVFREEDSDPGALWVLIPFEMEGDDSELLFSFFLQNPVVYGASQKCGCKIRYKAVENENRAGRLRSFGGFNFCGGPVEAQRAGPRPAEVIWRFRDGRRPAEVIGRFCGGAVEAQRAGRRPAEVIWRLWDGRRPADAIWWFW